MGVNSLPNTVTRQRRACDFWTQALLRMSPAWVRFHVYNTVLVQYRWTGLHLLKMQDWKIVNSSKYSLSCCTYVFHRCRFVLAFSVLAFSTLAYSYLRIPYLHIPSSGTFVFPTCVFSRPSDSTNVFINQRIECYLNNTITLRPLTPHIMPCYTHKMAIVSWPYILWRHFTLCIIILPFCIAHLFWMSWNAKGKQRRKQCIIS